MNAYEYEVTVTFTVFTDDVRTAEYIVGKRCERTNLSFGIDDVVPVASK